MVDSRELFSNEAVDRSEFFSNGCVICSIHFIYDINNVSLLHGYVTSIARNSDDYNDECTGVFTTRYYLFMSEENTRNINTLYNNSDGKSCFQHNHDNCSFCEISKKSFDIGIGKRFVIEIEYDGINSGDMIYIYLLAESLIAKNILVQFRIFKNSNNGILAPISSSLYQQIRTFLLLGNVNNNLFFYTEYKAKKVVSSQWQRLYTCNSLSERIFEEAKKREEEKTDDSSTRSAFVNIGRIFPLIPITKEMCVVLLNSDCISDFGMDIIIEKYKTKAIQRIPNVEEIIESDSCFEKLFFLATCAYLIDENDSISLENDKLSIIHERCVDYAQGIMQTVENALIHAVIKRNTQKGGCAALSLRIRKKSDATYVKNINSKHIDNARYFVEICVVDLLYEESDFVGIVDCFIDNAQRRYNNSDDADKEKWINQCGSPFDWNSKIIPLEDLFKGGSVDSVCRKYLTLPNVIAYHYGLQIFNNVILANGGYLEVWSKYPYKANEEYYDYKSNFSNWNGTIYTVFIPLHTETEINYADTIADNNFSGFTEINPIFMPVFRLIDKNLDTYNLENSLVPGGKNECVQRINKRISTIIKKNTNPETIYVFDCSRITKKYHYELIAKACFLLMANNPSFNNVALYKINSKQDVIKAFRQFALFYNREGRNHVMVNKSVYLVDVDAEMEIAFGGMITEIITNFQDQLLIGGVGESIKNIIYYLGGNYNNEEQ